MNSSQGKLVKISLNIEIPLDGSDPRVNVTRAMPLFSGSSNEVTLPTAAGPARVNWSNEICVEGQAYNSEMDPPTAVYAKIYNLANLPNPIPSTPDTPNTSANSIDVSGNYTFNAVPLPATSSARYALVTWAQLVGYPVSYVVAEVTFTTSSKGPYTDCTYPESMSRSVRSISQPASSAEMEVMPVAWNLKLSGFSGDSVQVFNGERKLNLVKSASQTILYCNGGDGVTGPVVQLRCSQPGTTDWELSFALGQKRVTYRQPSVTLQGATRKLFQNPMAIGLNEEDAMPAVVSIHPA